jgi:hypothetical protein
LYMPVVTTKNIGNIHSMICWILHSTGTDCAMAYPELYQGSSGEGFLDYVLEELIE